MVLIQAGLGTAEAAVASARSGALPLADHYSGGAAVNARS